MSTHLKTCTCLNEKVNMSKCNNKKHYNPNYTLNEWCIVYDVCERNKCLAKFFISDILVITIVFQWSEFL